MAKPVSLSQSSIVRPILAAVVVAWLFAVTVSYYVYHKPFTLETVVQLGSTVGDALVGGLVIALGAALGHRIISGIRFDSPLEAVVFQVAFGLGLLSIGIFGFGVAGLLNPLVLWVGAGAGLAVLRADLVQLWQMLRSIRIGAWSRWYRALLLYVIAVLALTGLYALLPPTAWDAQTYHLVHAKVALIEGRIGAPPDIPYFSFPSLGEMLFLGAMALKSDIAGQCLHFTFLVLTVGAVLSYAQRYFEMRVGILAAAMLAAVPSFVALAATAYVDAMLVFFAFGSFYACMRAREESDWRWIGLAGALAGLAMGVKYTAVIVPVALVLLLAWSGERNIRRWAIFVSGCALLAAPWYVRNLVFKGNPVYPFLFGGADWDAFRGSWFSRFGTGLMNEPLRMLLAPWEATIAGREGTLSYDATIGPLLLALLPLALLAIYVSRKSSEQDAMRQVSSLLLFSVVLYGFWLLGVAGSKLLLQTRLLFPALPTLALVAAFGFTRLSTFDLPFFSLQRFAQLLVTVVLGLTLLGYALAFLGGDVMRYVVGAMTRQEYLGRALGSYGEIARTVNSQLPADAKLITLWEPRSYYFNRRTLPDAILDRWAHAYWQKGSADAIASDWRAQGYTHVLISRTGLDYLLRTGYDPITPQAVTALVEFEHRHLRPLPNQVELQIDFEGGTSGLKDAQSHPFAVYELVADSK